MKLYCRNGMWCLDGNLSHNQFCLLKKILGIMYQYAGPGHHLRQSCPFWQCGSLGFGYSLIEFWAEDQSVILVTAEFICEALGCQLEL